MMLNTRIIKNIKKYENIDGTRYKKSKGWKKNMNTSMAINKKNQKY